MQNSDSNSESLELRVERVKRVGNLRLEHLKRCYQRESLIERYLDNVLEIHTHLMFEGVRVCGVYRVVVSGNQDIVVQEDEIIVLCEISQDGKQSRPVTSLLRLQFLDRCDMRQAEKISVTASEFLEFLWREGDRKLCSLYSGTVMQDDKLADHVIKSGAHTVGGFASNDSEPDCNGWSRTTDFPGFERLASWYSSTKLHLDDRGLSLNFADVAVQPFQLLKVFAAPIQLSISTI